MVDLVPSRNVTVAGRRTAMRLEPAFWEALTLIGKREGLSVDQLVTLISRRCPAEIV